MLPLMFTIWFIAAVIAYALAGTMGNAITYCARCGAQISYPEHRMNPPKLCLDCATKKEDG